MIIIIIIIIVRHDATIRTIAVELGPIITPAGDTALAITKGSRAAQGQLDVDRAPRQTTARIKQRETNNTTQDSLFPPRTAHPSNLSFSSDPITGVPAPGACFCFSADSKRL